MLVKKNQMGIRVLWFWRKQAIFQWLITGRPLLFQCFFANFGPEAVGRVQSAESTVECYKKRTSNIFHQKHNALLCLFFRKKCNGHETGVFLEKKIKKVQKQTSTVNSLFLILVILRQTHCTPMPFFSKKKSNGHKSGMFMEKKS